jgi:N-acylneuraminate cytidylyltransferase
VLAHALELVSDQFDIVVLLQPTSPLRTAADIDGAVQLLVDSGAPSVVSVCEVDKSPYWMYTLDRDNTLSPLLHADLRPFRRQDAPPVFVPNGAVYVVRYNQFLKNRLFVHAGSKAWIMPVSRSLDIDTLDDIELLEFICRQKPEILPDV